MGAPLTETRYRHVLTDSYIICEDKGEEIILNLFSELLRFNCMNMFEHSGESLAAARRSFVLFLCSGRNCCNVCCQAHSVLYRRSLTCIWPLQAFHVLFYAGKNCLVSRPAFCLEGDRCFHQDSRLGIDGEEVTGHLV